MAARIAKGFLKINSQRLVPLAKASSYRSEMRGEAKQKHRAARLRELQKRYSYEEMAKRCGGKAIPAYFSQIGNEVIGKGRKTPRQLSDAYAERLEQAFNLAPGWFDHSGGVQESQPQYGNTLPGPDTRGLVPLISWVQAGAWDEAHDPYEVGDGEDWLPCPAGHGLRSYALRVNGDSMTAPHGRSYPHNAIIYVDPEQRGGVTPGDRVIAKINGDNLVTFKVLAEDAGRRFLKPLNPVYPPIYDEFRILGKVIGTYIPE